jgi:hypothetical protein
MAACLAGWRRVTQQGSDFVRDRRSMPHALKDHTTCPGLELIYYWMYTKHRHELHHARKAWLGTLVDPCLLSGYNRPWPTDRYIPSPTILDMFSNHSWGSHDFHICKANNSKVTVPAEEMTHRVQSSHVDTKENWRVVQDMSSLHFWFFSGEGLYYVNISIYLSAESSRQRNCLALPIVEELAF